MGSSTKTLQYRYDSRGNRSVLIDHDGGRFTYSYDAVNRMTQVLNLQGDRTTYSYDNAGRRTLKKLANGTRASFTYDAAGNLTKLYNLKSTGAVVSSFDYSYDKVGNRTAVLEAGGSRVTWSYDNGYQLTGEHRTGSNAYRDTYTYDPAGNRLLKNHDSARTTYAYDAANQLTYSQDAGGRTTFTFDADGNQQVVREPSGNRTTYAWDYENRMTSARLPSGIRNTMAYDADGLRVKLEESTGTKKFVWDDQNYLGETDAANDTQVVYTNEPQQYGNLVSQRRGITSHWYHFDAIGSTRELSDASAVVTDTRLYDAWGNAIATTGSTVSPLKWVGDVGYYHDTQSGLYYVRARVYQPVAGLWLTTDPLGFAQSNVPHRFASPYIYASGRPVIVRDPSGLICVVAIEGLGGRFIPSERQLEHCLKPITELYAEPTDATRCSVVEWKYHYQTQGLPDTSIINDIKNCATTPLRNCPCCYHRVVLVGYSWGGNTAYDVMKKLHTSDPELKVDVVFTIDPVIGNPLRTTNWKADFGNYCRWDNYLQRNLPPFVGDIIEGANNYELPDESHVSIPCSTEVKDAFREILDSFVNDTSACRECWHGNCPLPACADCNVDKCPGIAKVEP